MACPGVAGSALILRQYFMDGFYPTGTKNPTDGFIPSGYLIKAAILNSGRPVLGRDNGESSYDSTPYDESQGFGLISLIDAVYLEGQSTAKVLLWDKVELQNEGVWEETIYIGNCDATQTSVTMTYFDKEAAHGCSTCMTNRLDLTVMKGGQTLYPNGLTQPDTKNNAQRVRFSTEGGSIDVRVEAKNLITTSQKFAVVVSGCVEIGTKNPAWSPGPSKISSPAPSTQTPTAEPTCFEDPNFAITRGFKKKGLTRTCAYFGLKKYRMKKWCNKRHRGQLISEICCVTCASKKCEEQEIHMQDEYMFAGETLNIKLPAAINNVQQVRASVWCDWGDDDYTSSDFILKDANGKKLKTFNILCGREHGKDVTKTSEVFDVIDGVEKLTYKMIYNDNRQYDWGLLYGLVAICTDVNGKEVEVPLN